MHAQYNHRATKYERKYKKFSLKHVHLSHHRQICWESGLLDWCHFGSCVWTGSFKFGCSSFRLRTCVGEGRVNSKH